MSIVTQDRLIEGVDVHASPNLFSMGHVDYVMPEGVTVLEIMRVVTQGDVMLARSSVATIDGHTIPRENWHLVRPKKGSRLDVNVLPEGGGGDGNKNILRIVLTVAIIAAAIYFGPALGAALAGYSTVAAATAAGATIAGVGFAAFGTAIIGLTGFLVLSVLAPPRSSSSGGGAGPLEEESPTLFVEGARNSARPFGTVPQVLGRYRITPPFGAAPFTEVIGDDHYLTLLYVWGIGPMRIFEDTFEIGETPLVEFDGVEIETREGYPSDEPLTLYPGQVIEEALNVLLKEVDGFTVRNSSTSADDLGIDVTFPQGLTRFDRNTGARQFFKVAVEIQYRKVGDTEWLTPEFTTTTVPDDWVDGSTVTFMHKRTAAIRHGFRWKAVSGRGSYEIRVRRSTADNDQTEVVDQVNWTAIRTFTNEAPIQSPVPIAMTVLRIRATDQLNGIVDTFTGMGVSVGKVWTGTEWLDDQEIEYPPDLYRLVLQGPANISAIEDEEVDLETLQDWKDLCLDLDYRFNMVRDFESSVWDTLADVASAGRAFPSFNDGKFSVVIERKVANSVTHVTPRNSYNFRFEKALIDMPDGWRLRFPNEELDYRQDEIRIYRNGFDESNARKFETLTQPGVTNWVQGQRLGRFRLMQGELQKERYSFSQDMEFLTYRRGDRILLTHDVIEVGLFYGRLKGYTLDTNNNVISIEVDEEITMEDGKDYTVSVRSVDDASLVSQVLTVPGTTKTLTLLNPFGQIDGVDAVQEGNIFGFGISGFETLNVSVLAVIPENDLKANVVTTPYDERVFDTENEDLPNFESTINPSPSIPIPEIYGVVSDESALGFGPGKSLETRAVIIFEPFNNDEFEEFELDAQLKPTDTNEFFRPAEVVSMTAGTVTIRGIETGERLDFRLRYRVPSRRFAGDWAYSYNNRIIGKSTPPAGLANMTIAAFGGSALIRWDRPSELDVEYGGTVQFRHSPLFEGATWETSSSIGTGARARDLVKTLALKPGTYFARVFDEAGIPSDPDNITSVNTKQASVLDYADVDHIIEDPNFAGTSAGAVGNNGILKIEGAGLFDDIPDFDAVPDLDSYGGIRSEGEYLFSAGMDFGTVKKVRITSHILMSSVNVFDDIDDRVEFIDTWESFDGDVQSVGDCVVYVRETDDDPSGSPEWSDWNILDSAEVEARGLEYKAVLSTTDVAFNVYVTELSVLAEETT